MLDKIIKYIPGEIVAAFLFINGILVSVEPAPPASIQWGMFFLLLILTPVYLWRVTLDPILQLPPATGQIFVGTVAFAAWVYAIGGPFSLITEGPYQYQAYLGSIAIALFTVVAPIVLGRTEESSPIGGRQ